MTRLKEKEEAISLREQGHSIKEIVSILNISAGSISPWVKHIKLTEEQRERLILKSREGNKKSGRTKRKLANTRHNSYIEKGKQLAIKNSNNPEFAAGCFLYWGEGSKTNGAAVLSNTDPDLLLFFTTWLCTYFNVTNTALKAHMIYHSHGIFTEEELKSFWMQKLLISESNFGKSTQLLGTENKKGKCPYGLLRIGIYSTEILWTIFGAIKFIGKIKRDSWILSQ